MRDRDNIDAEPRLIAAVRRAVRDMGGPKPSTEPMNELLDERSVTQPQRTDMSRRVAGAPE